MIFRVATKLFSSITLSRDIGLQRPQRTQAAFAAEPRLLEVPELFERGDYYSVIGPQLESANALAPSDRGTDGF
jgi:hypothetical protein